MGLLGCPKWLPPARFPCSSTRLVSLELHRRNSSWDLSLNGGCPDSPLPHRLPDPADRTDRTSVGLGLCRFCRFCRRTPDGKHRRSVHGCPAVTRPCSGDRVVRSPRMPLQPALREKRVSWMLAWNCIGPYLNSAARTASVSSSPWTRSRSSRRSSKSRSNDAAGSRFVTSHNSSAGLDP
jgi:hypothetical protein